VKRPLQGECEWYQLCQNGRFVATRCPTYGTGQRQMFNPITGNCTENKKLPLDGKCQLYRQCLVVDLVSPFGKWTEVACGSGQHFEQESQKCIEAEASTCSKCFPSFFVKSVFQVYFSKTNTILCASEIKACNENKCQNEGKCQEIGTDEYSCLCPIGFTGKHCECNYYV
jgi:hypothetical protein